jgi:hypothetical protein
MKEAKTSQAPARAIPARAPVVTSADIAEKLIAKLDDSMGELLELLREETALVKAGRLKAASELTAAKEEKSTLYTRLMLVARDEIAALKEYAPDATMALVKRHELFRSEVQINLAVLDTARDVAEDLMRTVAREVGRITSPQTYGRPGEQKRPGSQTAQGIAVNKNF